jgi:hypothetical protein
MASRASRLVVSLTCAVLVLFGVLPASRAHAFQTDPPDFGEMAEPAPIEVIPLTYHPEGVVAEVIVNDTPSGFKEKAIVYLPMDSLAQGPRPMLVVFHQYGKTHNDVWQNTTLIDECRERGWFCLAPLGGTKTNFASLPSQANVEMILSCAQSVFGSWLDRTRIYAIGFSMGAGDASTYAARHLDPWKPIFAAVHLHTGNHDKGYVWQTEPGVRDILEFWFGGTPSQEPFAYRQASTIEIGFPSGLLIAGDHLGRNLQHTATYSFYAFQDPFTHLKLAATRFYQYVNSFSALADGSVNTADLSGLPFAHTWASLDQNAACDWLATHQLTLPTSGRLVIDRKAQAWWYRIEPAQPEQFATLDWSIDLAARKATATNTRQLLRTELPYLLCGFAAGPLSVTTSSFDGSTDEFVLTGLVAGPQTVLLAGAPATAGTDYAFDATTGRLTLFASGVLQDWTIAF